MERKPVFISVCNQKGGIGKSTFTVLLADILHYMKGYRVLVADCDYPQKSIFDQRKRELALLDRSLRYKSLLVRQFGVTHREIWPVIASAPERALTDVDRQLGMLREPVDFVLFDLPGTVGTPGVLRTLSAIDRIFVPMKADRYVMESTLAFAKSVDDHLVRNSDVQTAGVHLFWTMIDRREPGLRCMTFMTRRWRNSDCTGWRPIFPTEAGSARSSRRRKYPSSVRRSCSQKKVLSGNAVSIA